VNFFRENLTSFEAEWVAHRTATTKELEKYGERTRQMLDEQKQGLDAAVNSFKVFISGNNQKMIEQFKCYRQESARVRGCLQRLDTKFSFFFLVMLVFI